MSIEVHLDWQVRPVLVRRLYPAAQGLAVTFEYDREWLARPGSCSIDPTSLPAS